MSSLGCGLVVFLHSPRVVVYSAHRAAGWRKTGVHIVVTTRFFATRVRVCVFLFQVIFLSGSAFRRDGFRCLSDAKCVGDVRVGCEVARSQKPAAVMARAVGVGGNKE